MSDIENMSFEDPWSASEDDEESSASEDEEEPSAFCKHLLKELRRAYDQLVEKRVELRQVNAAHAETARALLEGRNMSFNPNEQLASVILSHVHDLPTRLALSQVDKTFLAASKQDASLPGPEVLFAFAERCEDYRISSGIYDFKPCIQWCERAYAAGHPDAILQLGFCYYYGNGVERDYAKAFELFSEGAEKGCAYAMYWIGQCYHLGDGVEQEMPTAIEWNRKAAAKGNRHSQAWLAEHDDFVNL